MVAADSGDSDSDTMFDYYEDPDSVRQRAIKKEKAKGAHYISPYKDLQRVLDPLYWLEDDEMDRASKIIKHTNSDINGLEDVCVISVGHGTKCKGDFIQFVHAHGNHWVTATTVGCNPGVIRVYDSMYRNFDKSCLKLIHGMAPVDETTPVIIELAKFQKQRTKADCGLFAIAAAFSLVGGNNPSTDRYDCEQMRAHLHTCLKQNVLLPFPVYNGTISSQQQKMHSVVICCSCKDLLNLSADKTTLQCESCGKFCHVPNEYMMDACSANFNDMNLCRKCCEDMNFV